MCLPHTQFFALVAQNKQALSFYFVFFLLLYLCMLYAYVAVCVCWCIDTFVGNGYIFRGQGWCLESLCLFHLTHPRQDFLIISWAHSYSPSPQPVCFGESLLMHSKAGISRKLTSPWNICMNSVMVITVQKNPFCLHKSYSCRILQPSLQYTFIQLKLCTQPPCNWVCCLFVVYQLLCACSGGLWRKYHAFE